MLVEIAVALLVGVGIVAAPPSVRSHYQYSYIWSEPPLESSQPCLFSFFFTQASSIDPHLVAHRRLDCRSPYIFIFCLVLLSDFFFLQIFNIFSSVLPFVMLTHSLFAIFSCRILLEAFNIPNGKTKSKAKAKVKFTADEVRKVMDFKHNLRNISIIGAFGHGKSTLNDSLVTFAGSIPQEAVGDFTIKSTNTSIYYEMTESDLKALEGEHNGRKYIINLIDSPGHIEFSGEVNAALVITDGDCSEGVCIQTKNIIRHALLEGLRPVLTVNKMETCFLDCQADGEEVYKTLEGIINEVNATIDINKVPQLDDVTVSPAKGNVAFSSRLHGWAFTLKYFAEKYALEFDVDVPTMMERLWGENYFNLETQRWNTKRYSSRNCKHGFVQFCYKPIKAVIGYCINDQKDRSWPVLKELGVTLTSKEKKLVGRELVKSVMRKWFPAPPV